MFSNTFLVVWWRPGNLRLQASDFLKGYFALTRRPTHECLCLNPLDEISDGKVVQAVAIAELLACTEEHVLALAAVDHNYESRSEGKHDCYVPSSSGEPGSLSVKPFVTFDCAAHQLAALPPPSRLGTNSSA